MCMKMAKGDEAMVVPQAVFDALKSIGLNLYERKLWVALLGRGTATAGELSSLAKVPHSRTYDVLESLAEKGFVLIQTTKPIKYVAIAPSEALERAKKKIKEDADIAINRLTSMQSSPAMKELERIFKHGVTMVEPGELTGSLKGRNAMHNQLETIFKGAKSHVSILTSAEGLSEIHNRHADVLKKLASKGVKIRIAAPVNKENSAMVEALKSFADVKKISESKSVGRFVLVDGTHLIIALTNEKDVHPTQDLALWTQSDHVAGSTIGPMFEAMWAKLPPA
ncbi:MAG: helix-turn-helix domain-containing protein [Candidatus Aenigmatarchaeota archaeon]|nr:hypothetical protein [Candidatus Aenigmarchaeota archaeon]